MYIILIVQNSTYILYVTCIAEVPSFLLSIELAIMHSVFINGDLTNFEIEPSFGVEASELYPEYKFTSVDEYFATIA